MWNVRRVERILVRIGGNGEEGKGGGEGLRVQGESGDKREVNMESECEY